MHDQTDGLTDGPTDEMVGELAGCLGELAGSTAPGRGFDVTRAMREGRVRLRRRRLVTVGTAVVAVAATMAVSLLPSGGGSVRRTAVAAPPAPAAHSGDPIVVEASYGWLPAGYQLDYLPQQGSTVVRANGKVPDGVSVGPIIWLKVYPAGTTPSTGQPWYRGGPRQYRVQAAPVGGRPAYWVGTGPTTAAAPAGGRNLRWQTADGRWAEMQADYLTGADAPQTLHRIAEGVVVARHAVPLPYRISGLPAGAKLYEAAFVRAQWLLRNSHIPWISDINFMVDGMSITTTIRPGPAPAASDSSSQDEQTCMQAHGLSVCTESEHGANAYRAVGGPEAWLKKFTLLGTDESNWTTDVLG